MNSPAHATHGFPRLAPLAGAIGGTGVTCAIALALGLVSTQRHAPVDFAGEEIAAVSLPDPPPPPPPSPTTEGMPLPPAPIALEESHSSTSTVVLPASPIPVAPLIREVRPAYSLSFDFVPGRLDADITSLDTSSDHVFQPTEVDHRAVPIYRKVPDIPGSLLREVKVTRVRLLFVVNIDGTVENVRVLHGVHREFDRRVVEAVEQWRFRPAMRKGKKVRCIAELPVYVKAPNRDPFSID